MDEYINDLMDADESWLFDMDEEVDTSDFQDYEIVNNVDSAFDDWD